MTTQSAHRPVEIDADHATVRRLGTWTTSRAFRVRARQGVVVLDLRSPSIAAGDVQIELDTHRSAVKLLVDEHDVIDQWSLTCTGRGKLNRTFHAHADAGGRRIRLRGHVRDGQVRVLSGGAAQLSAILTREFLSDARRANAQGLRPTVHDPAGRS
ncbi:MAG TPA: hypothetical protein VH395_07220 [Jatrophihabitantaceae bacterium]|jgi:hypothetical protein